MYDPNNHVIHSADGQLKGTTRDDVRRIVSQAIASQSKSGIVVHFHGGLVSESSAKVSAEQKLYPLYADQSKAYPIFFIWESGFFEAPLNNLKEIVSEGIFQEFVKKVAEWVLKTLPADIGFKGGGGANINEAQLRDEFDAWFSGSNILPRHLEVQHGTTDAMLAMKTKGVSLDEDALLAKLEVSIAGDDKFQFAVQAVYKDLHEGGHPRSVTRGAGASISTTSLIDKEAAGRMFEYLPETVKGFAGISWFKVAQSVAAIVIRVIRRFRAGRAHGMYVTLVEEVLRALYIDKIGQAGWWDRMKADTADAFKDGQQYCGTAFLTELKEQLVDIVVPPKITLVGHSTGAIYICNLLKAAAQSVPSLHFDIIFEAPAATHEKLASTVAIHGSRIRNFRQFGMCDKREASDVLVPIIYLSSLLYFISSMLEHDTDEPLVGMARYLDKLDIYNADEFPNIASCRQFYAKYPKSLVWSLSNAGPGLNSDGEHHGEFDDVDKPTMDSVSYILLNGF